MKLFKRLMILLTTTLSLTGCSFIDLVDTHINTIEINHTSYSLEKDQTVQLIARVTSPLFVFDNSMTWNSTNPSIASVDNNGLVTAKALGESLITVLANDGGGAYAQCQIKVLEEVYNLMSIHVLGQKTDYNQNDTFVKPQVYARYENRPLEDSREVTNQCKFSGYDLSKTGQQTVNVSYTENGVTKTTSYSIIVTAVIPDIDDNPISKTKLLKNYKDYHNNSVYEDDSAPSLGDLNLLVIPVWFKDSTNYISSAKKDSVREDIEKAYFGSTTDTGWHSVKTYYEAESYGKLTLGGTVSEWYDTNRNVAYYADDEDQTTTLVEQATNWYFTNNPSDKRRNYDSDKNGYLDGVILIYAAPDYLTLKNENYSNLWAYCYWVQKASLKNTTNPGPNTFFWASYDFIYGTNATSKTGKNYAGGNTTNCKLDAHTFIHEMGHIFGLSDYYDYSDNEYCPAGAHTMQDFNVGGHDPYSVMVLGWADPYVPTESMTLTIKPFVSSGDLILLSPNFNTYDSPFDEYLLLELYTPKGNNEFDSKYSYRYGYPTLPTQPGIRVWHIDARLAKCSTSSIYADFTSNPNISGYSVIHAMSNTYNDGHISEGYLSPLGSSYYDYNILQYIRKDPNVDYKPSMQYDSISNNNMFKQGNSFSMSMYGSQFKRTGKLNSNVTLGWSFKVDKCSATEATITLVRG